MSEEKYTEEDKIDNNNPLGFDNYYQRAETVRVLIEVLKAASSSGDGKLANKASVKLEELIDKL